MTSAKNTDRELWREREGDFYAPALFVTEGGGIGIDVGGSVIVKPIRDWHKLASPTYSYDPEKRTLVPASEEAKEKISRIIWDTFAGRQGGPFEGSAGTVAREVCDGCASAILAAIPQQQGWDELQRVVIEWGARCFGADHMRDPIVRAARFLEEAAELAQAVGLPKDHALRALDHVYSRPAGDPAQEAGGSANTLMALCGALGLSAGDCQRREIERCLALPPEHFAKRNVAKIEQVDNNQKFIFFECPECGFSSVQRSDFKGSDECPLCAGDSGHSVTMRQREALPSDKPEGRDARKRRDDEAK